MRRATVVMIGIAMLLVLTACGGDAARPIVAKEPALDAGMYWVHVESGRSYIATGETQVAAGPQSDYQVIFDVADDAGELFARVILFVPSDARPDTYTLCPQVTYDVGGCAPRTIGVGYQQLVSGALLQPDEFASGEVTLDEADGLSGSFQFYVNFFDANEGAEVSGAFKQLMPLQ